MLSGKTHPQDVNLSHPLSRELEDQLDWQENAQRTEADIRRVDGVFLGLTYGAALLWIVLGTGLTGGVLAVGTLIAQAFR
jgi:hypothetical protein